MQEETKKNNSLFQTIICYSISNEIYSSLTSVEYRISFFCFIRYYVIRNSFQCCSISKHEKLYYGIIVLFQRLYTL